MTPRWDNTARRKRDGRILIGSTPQLYKAWLTAALKQTRQRYKGDEQIVFINAWNEWAEGCHLEPDLRYGRGYLEATKQAITDAQIEGSSHEGVGQAQTAKSSAGQVSPLRSTYWRARERVRYMFEILRSALRLPAS